MIEKIGCYIGLILDPQKIILSLISLSISFFTLLLLKKTGVSTKLKISLIYAHLTSLVFPFVLFGTHVGCGIACMPCYNNVLSLVSYALPTTLFISTISSFFVVPSLYIITNKKRIIKSGHLYRFIKKYSEKMKISEPKIYVIDKAEPIAFSFRTFKSAIFLSVGVLDILKDREIECVALHELSHLKEKSSITKISLSMLKLFSPFSLISGFNIDSTDEEKKADNFVLKEQKTKKYLILTKKRFQQFKCYKK
ncbi:MAG: M48 family metalloprotease [Candidatus Aenigmarchaeota archaeon]|nr:M48 family metalloprotease [Candidatus Aenigmarchaeota archaeon]